MRWLALALALAAETALAQVNPTKVVIDLSQPAQSVTVKTGDLPLTAIRAMIEPGDMFPQVNSKYQTAREVIASGAAVQAYHKVWKGDLKEISVRQPAVVVYQHPVKVAGDYGSDRYELRDLYIACDFTLSGSGKSARLDVLTWYQMPSGARGKLTILSINRERNDLERGLAKAQQASDSLPALRSNLASLQANANPREFTDNGRALNTRLAFLNAQKAVNKAEAMAATIPDVKKSLDVIPDMIRFGEQLHQRANFTVAFWAEQDGKRIDLKPEQ